MYGGDDNESQIQKAADQTNDYSDRNKAVS